MGLQSPEEQQARRTSGLCMLVSLRFCIETLCPSASLSPAESSTATISEISESQHDMLRVSTMGAPGDWLQADESLLVTSLISSGDLAAVVDGIGLQLSVVG